MGIIYPIPPISFAFHSLCSISQLNYNATLHYIDSKMQYLYGEEVILWVNKAGPIRNPQETYLYYSLPWCVAENKGDIVETETPREGLGEALMGYELRRSGIDIQFQRMLILHSVSRRDINNIPM